MGAVTLILIGLFAFVFIRLSQPPMGTLFSGLSPEDVSAVTKQLESGGVHYELKGDGSTISVPASDVTRLRIQLAGNGLPTGGSVGYEIFDKQTALGTTSSLENINRLRALEGELARTIKAINRVDFARVHLVVPARQLFQREQSQPSASIVLKVRGGLEPGEVRAIQHLVASAVDGLRPARVSIVDESGRLLASGAGDDTATAAAAALDERAGAFEKKLQDQIGEIVSSVVGTGRARIQVAATLDRVKTTRTDDTFDPNGQVVRSTQSKAESSTAGGGQAGPVSAGNALNAGGAGGAEGRESANNTEETINYEISRSTTTSVTEAGQLKRLSVAVLVDGVYTKDAAGALQYAPRSQEELDRIATLVRSTIGFDKARGDEVQVINLRFAEPPRFDTAEPAPTASGFNLEKTDYFYLAELVVSTIVGLLIILLVVRPLIRRIVTPETPPAAGDGAPPQLAGGEGAAPALPPRPPMVSPATQQIEKAIENGALQADAINRVGSLVQDNTADAVSIVRSWLADAA